MDEKLIDAVRNCVSLWDVSFKSYKDAQCKENAWKEVSEKVGELMPEECSKGPFCERTQENKEKEIGESGPCYVSRWPFFETMMFLSNSVRHRDFSHFGEKKGVDDEVQNEEDNVEVFDESLADKSNSHTDDVSRPSSSASKVSLTPPPSKKRKRKEDPLDELLAETLKAFHEKRTAKEQPVSLPSGSAYHFGIEIAWRLDKVTPRQRAMEQLRIQQVLKEIEFPAEHFMSPIVVQPYS